MRLIFTGVVLATSVLLLAACFGISLFGLLFALFAFPLVIAGLIVVEVWLHRYIMRNGRFVLISIGQRNAEPEES